MHSHGNIDAILDDVVGAGVNMLNPLDSTDGMDLAETRQRHPRLTLVGGGIDTSITTDRLTRSRPACIGPSSSVVGAAASC